VINGVKISNGVLDSSCGVIQGINPEFSFRDWGNTNKNLQSMGGN